jgi:D-alanyl-lipoteichoic acid acyltransferase DltB (MBOAT superfamily)
MLFNSYVFLFGFLPATLLLFYLWPRHPKVARAILSVASLGFYAWWRPIYLPLLLGSIVFNYFLGDLIQRAHAQNRESRKTALLVLGLVADLGLLGWFKYANFVVDNFNLAFSTEILLAHIALPLAISFFTFQKIAYLIDSARGEAQRMSLLDFTLFASFFPQLISGPIVHYKEMVPQIQAPLFGRLIWRNVLIGLTIMAIGLFKKTVIADTLYPFVTPLYDTAAKGGSLGFVSGWLAAITFTFQLYFDFSGYSDMAIGLARMFGVKLPLNFHSPLRARSIADYWRRWHMTLQRFIYAYLFQPVSLAAIRWSAQKGLSGWTAFAVSSALPTFITFVCVGLWHGAGWTFIFFGVLHAIYIIIQEFRIEQRRLLHRRLRKLKQPIPDPGRFDAVTAHVATLAAILFANVVFRSSDLPTAFGIWKSMIGLDGLAPVLPVGGDLLATLAVSFIIVAFFPNTQQIMGRFEPAFNWSEWRDKAPALLNWRWAPTTAGLIGAGFVLFLGVIFIQRGQAVFLYFNF